MKRIILTALATTIAVGLLAQGKAGSAGWRRFESPYDGKTPPPIGLSEAYGLALVRLGAATNRFYCVSGGCLEKTKRGLPGWTFYFSNTNGERAYMEVSFDKEVDTDAQSAELLRDK
jgi:hypothetical protein